MYCACGKGSKWSFDIQCTITEPVVLSCIVHWLILSANNGRKPIGNLLHQWSALRSAFQLNHEPFCVTRSQKNITVMLFLSPSFYLVFLLFTFRAESPGQVFLLAIHYLYRRLKDVPEEEWEEFILSYDNMCNVRRMLCARQPLPLNPPFDKLWLKVTKVIDRLHLRNHKNKQCHEIFSPEPFKEKNPHLNTPVAEQVFTWSARFKKILCAMPQERFLFYYHRMVVRRNRYTSKCHRESRPPVLPKVRSQFST